MFRVLEIRDPNELVIQQNLYTSQIVLAKDSTQSRAEHPSSRDQDVSPFEKTGSRVEKKKRIAICIEVSALSLYGALYDVRPIYH